MQINNFLMLGASVDCVSFPCKSIQMTIFFNVSIFNVADLLCRILPIAFFQHPLCTTVERIQSFKLYRWIISWWQVTNFEIALSRVIWFALLPRHFFFFLGPRDLSCEGKNCFGIRPLRLRWFVTQRKKICSVVNYEI